jgi:hypothetical protein
MIVNIIIYLFVKPTQTAKGAPNYQYSHVSKSDGIESIDKERHGERND